MNDLDINNSQLPDFIVPGVEQKKDEPIKIKVVGVGGGGGNAVNYMYRQNIQGVSLALCNTDPQAMSDSPVPIKVAIGDEGAGGEPEEGKRLAEEYEQKDGRISALFEDETRMVFITAGMGGGTGTGAGPVVARIAKEKGMLTVGIVTIPFLFEGEPKILQAFAGVEER